MKPTHLRPGAPLIVDGRDAAVALEAFPEGSTSYLFPHVCLRFVGGSERCVLHFSRVELSGSGEGKVATIEDNPDRADPWRKSRKARLAAIRVTTEDRSSVRRPAR